MCARITATTTGTEIADLFGLAYDLTAEAARPRFNVAPSQPVPVIRTRPDGAREVVSMQWGLVPHWTTNPRHRGFVNACAETAATLPSFRDPFRYRRALVPVGGFFEWQKLEKARQPYYFSSAEGGPLVLAGLWDRCGSVEGLAILTVEANELVRPLHDRMPAVLAPEDFAAWIDPRERDPANLLPLLRPYPAESMRRWPVDRRVNSVKVDEPGLTAAVELPDRPAQPSLFDAACARDVRTGNRRGYLPIDTGTGRWGLRQRFVHRLQLADRLPLTHGVTPQRCQLQPSAPVRASRPDHTGGAPQKRDGPGSLPWPVAFRLPLRHTTRNGITARSAPSSGSSLRSVATIPHRAHSAGRALGQAGELARVRVLATREVTHARSCTRGGDGDAVTLDGPGGLPNPDWDD
jgi:putative SOS response-associated peptidase YedK